MLQPQPDRAYTYEDLCQWQGEERWELIEGVPYAMGSPTMLHQALAMELSGRLWLHFRGGPCRVLAAPFDVRLSERDVVQPDLLVTCDADALQPRFLDGPPQLVIEILSPSNERHDRSRKLNLYARAGVSEYWLVTPHPFLFEVLRNRSGIFEISGVYSEQDRLKSPTFPDLQLDLAELYRAMPWPQELREPAPPYSTV